ncbi:MAG: hypothetical protein MI750_15100, partial [Xanthomonadales bacterium]|nr:hypothetical protein [Xanthomonadales bacterium]
GDFDGDGTREFEILDGTQRHVVSLDAEGNERWRLSNGFNTIVANNVGNTFSSSIDSVDRFVDESEMADELAKRLLDISTVYEGLDTATQTQIEAEVTTGVQQEFISKAVPYEFYTDLDNDGRVDLYGAIQEGTGPYVLAFSHWRAPGTGSANDPFELIKTNLPLNVNNTDPARPYVTDNLVFGDVTGDGLVDALKYRSVMSQCGTSTTANAIELYANQGWNSSNEEYQFTNQGVIYEWPCVEVEPGVMVRERGSRPSLVDFNGDGVLDINIQSTIPDVFLPDYNLGGVNVGNVVVATGYQSATLRYLVSNSSSPGTFSLVNLWNDGANDAGLYSDPRRTYHLPLDVNGDGLNDHVFIANAEQGQQLNSGSWYVQINEGGKYSTPKLIHVPNELAIALRYRSPSAGNVNKIIAPQYANLIKPTDWNSDGRADLLVPWKLDEAICIKILHKILYNNLPNNTNPTQKIYGTYCPGNMDGVGVEERQIPDYDLAEEGLPVPESTVGGLHFNGLGHHDRSTYEMRVVEFSYNELNDDYSFELNTPSTPVIASKTSKVVDINGD